MSFIQLSSLELNVGHEHFAKHEILDSDHAVRFHRLRKNCGCFLEKNANGHEEEDMDWMNCGSVSLSTCMAYTWDRASRFGSKGKEG